ncbi:hypothetical protein SBRCBS47491_009833 [Sporothrix bragantina]|uniref:Short chain dehydrogenase reductase n=1 Tax=Sporothrix bragantina TaxID=671064 RepID=A0ABP0D0I6_9PEZI
MSSETTPSLQAAGLFRVDGLVAVITGGGTGIGLTMARALAANGARFVFLLGRRKEVLETSAASINDIEQRTVAVPVVCDVGDKASIQAAVDSVTATLEALPEGNIGVHLVVANAGVVGPATHRYDPVNLTTVQALRQRMFTDVDMAAITDVFHINVTGAYFTAMAFVELLDLGNKTAHANTQTQVLVTASISAFMRGPPSAPAYAGSKAAILQMTKQLAAMLAPYRIRANALAPGLFPSELAAGLIGSRDPSTENWDHPAFIPARRFGSDAEVAGMVLYLASAAGGFCNGTTLLVDGGRTAVTTGNI